MEQEISSPPGAAASTAGLSLAAKRALAERLLQNRAGAAAVVCAQSYSQRSLWFIHQLAPASATYHIAFAARIRSPLDTPALERALGRMAERHAALRTTFGMDEEGPVQRVAPWGRAGLELVDAAGWDEDFLYRQVQQAHARPFDLETGPVVRATLFVRPPSPVQCEDHLLLVVAHHIVMDGWSYNLYLNDLLAFYAAEHEGCPPPPLSPSATQYTSYVAWQRQLLAGPEGERLWTFWRQELSGELPTLALPKDRTRPPVLRPHGATLPVVIEPALAARLRTLARSEGVTLYMLLLSAWQLALSALAGQEEVLIGSPVAGRTEAAFNAVIGHFVNMVVLRLHSPAEQPFRDFLAHVRAKVLAALDHQDFPFALLVERLHIPRDLSRSPLFQVQFNLHHLRSAGPLAPLFLPYAAEAGVTVASLRLEPYLFPQQEGQFDLDLELVETDAQLFGAIKYNTDLFEPVTAAQLGSALQNVLEKIVDNPGAPVAALRPALELLDLNSFVAHLRTLDIRIWVEGDRLRVNAPAGCMTPDLQKEISRRKAEIIALLTRTPATAAAGPQLKPLAQQGPLPLSFSQQRLWFLDQVNPGSAAYNIAGLIEMEGQLNVEALRLSFSEIVRRHAVLRTRIVVSDGQPGQVVDPYRPLELPLVDLQHLPPAVAAAEAQRLARQMAALPFDLASSPLLRAALYQLGPAMHLLAVACHHIVSDGWSLGVTARELAALYPAFDAGQPSPLPPLPIQYGDFAVWQRQWAQGERMQQDLAYWQRQLAGPLPVLDLPTDYSRPAVASTRGRRREFIWERSLVDALGALARQEGASLYMTLLAAFNVLLHRYTRQEDLLVGSPVAGRTQSETENLIGFFVNNLVLRTDVSGAPTFRQLLARVRKTVLEAFDHQHIPFDHLVDALRVQRDPSRSPFFQVLFSLQNYDSSQFELDGVKMRSLITDLETSRFDLTLELWEEPDKLRVHVEYCTDLFTEATIERMMGHYVTLLHAILENPDARIAELPLLTDAERRQLLVGWNDTAAEYPRHLPVHRLFEAQAAQRPAATAVTFAGESLTYADLNRRANRLARHLQALGVRPGALVGIYLERSIGMIEALLAIHKAGGAYLPLDPAFPADRLAFMIEDSQTRFLITQQSLQDHLPLPPGAAPAVVRIDGDWPQLAGLPDTDLPDPAGAADDDGERLAYVLYTSGSTGRPKGVQVQQPALVNFLTSMQREPGLGPEDILLAVTTLSFDIAGLEIFLPLITGAQVVMASQATAADGAALLELLQSCGATVMQATPATWRLLIAAGWQGSGRLKILCGGEALPGELAGQLLARCASLWNMYGPTETTIWSTVHPVTAAQGVMPIGHPIANTQVYVLNEALQPAPVGVAGELYIGGDGVTCGYLNRPELTAEKFVPDPFAGGGARMYRTGDLVRWRAGGSLEFLGRIDFQVKIRGFRIELGEIEAVLDEYPAIRQAVVVAREDRPGEGRLVAYFVPAGAMVPTAAELRGYLKEKLPDYMTPAVLMPVDAFPLTPNGKVDRKALPAPEASRVEAGAHYVAPRSETERQIASIWQAVLGLERVGVTDNFFDLGGHSLLIVQVHNQLRRSFATELSIAQMFQHPTVEALAACLQRPQDAAGSLQGAQERAARQRRSMAVQAGRPAREAR